MADLSLHCGDSLSWGGQLVPHGATLDAVATPGTHDWGEMGLHVLSNLASDSRTVTLKLIIIARMPSLVGKLVALTHT